MISNSFLIKAGRIFYGIPFAFFGFLHFWNNQQMTDMTIPNWPANNILVYIAGAGLILASISIILNKLSRIACMLLALELLIFIIGVHIPSILSGDEMAVQMSMTNLLKDMGLMGGALVVSGISPKPLEEE